MKKTTNKGSRNIKCQECGGIGHIISECANTLKKNKKSLKATWSDESEGSLEDNKEEAEDLTSHYISFPVTFSNIIKGVANCVATLEATS